LEKVKVTYIISNIHKSIAFEWIAEYLNKDKYALSFVFLNGDKYKIQEFMDQNGIPTHLIKFKGKKTILCTFFRLLFYFIKERPNVVHCHMFDAAMLGLLVSKLLFIKKRIYTRHNATFNREYFPKMVKWDRLNNRLATHIVAISKNVKNVLVNLENTPDGKVHLIPHGFDLKQFRNISESDRTEILKKYKLERSKDFPVIGVIARFLHLKGIQYIIPAFKTLLEEFPNAVLILCNSKGPYANEIDKLLQEIPAKNYKKIPFEEDLFKLYSLFDLYVHVPINSTIEAFGQTYVEALAAGVPSIFTLSGIAPEFVVHKNNAMVVDFENSQQIYLAMKEILESDKLKEQLKSNGLDSIKEFNLENFINRLSDLYG